MVFNKLEMTSLTVSYNEPDVNFNKLEMTSLTVLYNEPKCISTNLKWRAWRAQVKYLLEGHDRGVNWASFHPTLPLIVSGLKPCSLCAKAFFVSVTFFPCLNRAFFVSVTDFFWCLSPVFYDRNRCLLVSITLFFYISTPPSCTFNALRCLYRLII